MQHLQVTTMAASIKINYIKISHVTASFFNNIINK